MVVRFVCVIRVPVCPRESPCVSRLPPVNRCTHRPRGSLPSCTCATRAAGRAAGRAREVPRAGSRARGRGCYAGAGLVHLCVNRVQLHVEDTPGGAGATHTVHGSHTHTGLTRVWCSFFPKAVYFVPIRILVLSCASVCIYVHFIVFYMRIGHILTHFRTTLSCCILPM